MSGYCAVAPGHPVHASYHDTEHGFPSRDDAVLLERLSLEIFQAGLSWEIVLKRRAGIAEAFDHFDLDRVAAFGPERIDRLVADPRIIRHRQKVVAIVENARRIQVLRAAHGSFAAWLDLQHPLAKADWVKLFKRTFVFTGGEIVGELLMSLGYLPGAHAPDCPVAGRIAALRPPWLARPSSGVV